MSRTTAFIAELVWAANQSQHLTTFEKRRMLERAVATIRDMREQAGIPSQLCTAGFHANKTWWKAFEEGQHLGPAKRAIG
ncbi:hypothetical protein [Ensifer canadensis]|uniref:hypothetical protein n=1 Tax=Ensifer canadensis TaxID=555315 RepID=UPI00148F6347